MEGPDVGWAWVVAFSALMINFIIAGLGRVSGILFVAFIDIFGLDRKSATMPFSVRSSVRNLFGPVVGILGQKYGPRNIILVGGVIGTISSALCFFTPDIMWITILWGGFNGMGTALTGTLPQVVIAQYFIRHRTTAAGMGFSGGCVGSFLFPALMEYLIQTYGIDGTFFLMSAIFMHCIPAALILKKPRWLSAARKEDSEKKAVFSTHPCSANYKTMESRTEDALEIHPNMVLLRERKDLLLKMIQFTLPSETRTLKDIENLFDFEHNPQNKSNTNDILYKEKRSHSRSPSYRSFHMKASNEEPRASISVNEESVASILDHLLSVEKMEAAFPEKKDQILLVLAELRKLKQFLLKSKEVEKVDQIVIETSGESSNTFREHIKTAIKLYVNPLFLMIGFSRAIHFITFVPVMTTVVDFSMDKGFPLEDGKYVIAAISVGDLVGRIGLGWITDRGFMNLPRYMMVVMVLQGINTATIPMMHSKAAVFCSIVLFGLLQGSLFVRHPVLVSKYMRPHQESIAMGCVNLFSGLLGFGLPAYIGYFRDTLGSYSYIFYINGILGACIGLLWALEPFFVKCVNVNVAF